MPIISMCSQKGGVGKSTLAISLGWELMAQGKRVLIADADPQETCLDAVAKALQDSRKAPHCVRFGEDLHRVLPDMAEPYDWTIIDTPGRLGKVSRAALAVSDVALVPVRPSAPDAWALEQTIALVEEAKQARPKLRAALVLTQVRRTLLGEAARQGLSKLSLPLFKSCTMTRTAWEWAMYQGTGVTEHAPTSSAADELRGILSELLHFMKGKRR